MSKLKGLVLKSGVLARAPSLSPAERVAFLVDKSESCELTPVPTAYVGMDFPAGIFNRAYEELHYLDMILCEAATEHTAKEFLERPRIEDLAKGYSVMDETLRQQQQQFYYLTAFCRPFNLGDFAQVMS
ncbi:hypothetical protein [Halomonas llamarensis]|uniref:Uncharacterized protein n=1 Tax=Halomonas llamarensis TaxID=2945104 RepID=A0ABT0STM2_9GAMM|nr:hypothetical protein [Halomonas llamarensis]MCL7931142.1 hypothetical protein [Halomonas llamarensis]